MKVPGLSIPDFGLQIADFKIIKKDIRKVDLGIKEFRDSESRLKK